MKYDYDRILKELKSLKTPEEKRLYIQKTIKEIKLSESMTLTHKPEKRFDHLSQRISYLEDVFALRNILIESIFTEE